MKKQEKNKKLYDVYEKEAREETQLTSYEYELARLKKEKILTEAQSEGSVIEIGCGEGQIINYVKAKEKLGVDISPTRIRQATQNARKIREKTMFQTGDAEKLAGFKKKYDVIIASELVEHLPEPGKFFRGAKNLMGDGSIMILTTPNIFSLRRILAKIFFGRSGDKTHLHTFSPKRLEELLKSEGFTVTKHIPLTFEYVFYNRIPFGKFFDKLDKPVRRLIAMLFPKLSDVIFFIVKKTGKEGVDQEDIGKVKRFFFNIKNLVRFPGSVDYWERRYTEGLTSGLGSYGHLAKFKAKVINDFIREKYIGSVIELGCGDGNQTTLLKVPSYIGLDVSKTAIKICKERFKNDKTKSFFIYESGYFVDNHPIFKADMSLSLDVIYHIVEDNNFEEYMKHLFNVAEKYVVIYSSNTDENKNFTFPHFKNRAFSRWVAKNLSGWKLVKKIENNFPNESVSEFFFYEKIKKTSKK